MSTRKQTPASAEEINRLHAEVAKMSVASRDALNAALVAAWKAGQLLVAEKRNVRRTMGPGAWQLWLERYFTGRPRTAQHYMRLAKGVTDIASLHGLSLRQAYFRLGIATEPKLAARVGLVNRLPKYITLSMRLLAELEPNADQLSPELRTAYRQDLRPLYERLRALF
jgi:lambda repressor-like predicted transcriptional regulator